MKKPQFMNDNTIVEQENILMLDILKGLKMLGGSAYKKELTEYIRINSENIPEDFVMYERTSSKSGRKYKPYNFRYNFSLKMLNQAGYINLEEKSLVTLTEKGRNINFSQLDVEADIRNFSEEEVETVELNLDNDLEEFWDDELINRLCQLSPADFELFCRGLIKKMGVEIDQNTGVTVSNDGGIDGYGYITSDDFRTARVALQAKRWNPDSYVGSPEIDKFRGAMDKYNAEFGVFITTTDFTRNAIEASRIGTRVITLINGAKLCELVKKYEHHVKKVVTYDFDSDIWE